MKTVKYAAALAGKLLLIAAVVALALAFVNSVTAPVIARHKAEKLQQAIETVLPGGGESIPFTDRTGLVSTLYRGEQGYAVEVNPAGFGGTITMMVGVTMEGTVLAVDVVSQTETAGLGAVIAAGTADGEEFRGQFAGLSGSAAVDQDGGSIDSVTGATISSRAVCTGINAALDCVANLG